MRGKASRHRSGRESQETGRVRRRPLEGKGSLRDVYRPASEEFESLMVPWSWWYYLQGDGWVNRGGCRGPTAEKFDIVDTHEPENLGSRFRWHSVPAAGLRGLHAESEPASEADSE